MSKVIGIDISKATFDVSFEKAGKWEHHIFPSLDEGFKAFSKVFCATDHCVMEASGPYYLPLAIFLSNAGVKVSVVNPLIIKRFSQMRLVRAKTDKKDARVIAEYARQESPAAWVAEEKQIVQMRQLFTAIQGLGKQINLNRLQLESFVSTGLACPTVKRTLTSLIRILTTKQEQLQARLTQLAKQHYQSTIDRLQTIPGLGPKTAILLTVITNNFQKFEHSRQLTAYIGLSPRVYQSGTSVRGKGHICKMGSGQVRKQLYMCSWTAKFYNPVCKQMYHRLKAKGKPERLIKVAIANKLLKQAFALIKNQQDFDQNYKPKPCF